MKVSALNRVSLLGFIVGIASPSIWATNLLALPSQAQSTQTQTELINVDCFPNTVTNVNGTESVSCQLYRQADLPLSVSTPPIPRALPEIDSDTEPAERFILDDIDRRDRQPQVQEVRVILPEVANENLGQRGSELVSIGDNRFQLVAGERIIVQVESLNFRPEVQVIGPLGRGRRVATLSMQRVASGVFQSVLTIPEDGEYRFAVFSRDGNDELFRQTAGYTLSVTYE